MRLMTPPLPAEVATLEDHDDAQLVMLDPILKADEFVLEAEQFAKIEPAIELAVTGIAAELVEALVFEILLPFLVVAVEDLAADHLHQRRICGTQIL